MRKTLPIHMMLLLVLVFLSCLSARAQLWHADLGVLESTEDIIVSASVTYIAVNTTGGNEETPDITEIEESLTEQIENYGWSEWLSIKFLENPGSGQFEIDFALTENTTIADRSFTVGPNGGWITITQEAGEAEPEPDPEPSPEPDSGDDDGWLGPYVPERYRADTSGLRISNDRNWILTVIPNGGDGKDRYDITYYDGLGYDEQTISIGDSGGDHVTLTGRDAFFRPYKKYLPFPVSGNKGAYVESAETAQDAWYRDAFGLSSASACAWTETIMEPYADGRVLSEMKPGAEYRERGLSATKDYRFNREGEVLLLGVTDDSGLIVSGHYSPSSLNVMESEDEEGRRTETFTDNEGRTVLVRHFPDVSDSTFTSDTYFAYDIFGQQCWTVLPEGSALLETGQTYPAPPDGFTEASGYEVDTSYANEKERKLGKTLSSTRTGKTQLLKLISNPNKIIVKIDDIVKHSSAYGITEQEIDGTTGNVKKMTITIYENKAKGRANKSDGLLTTEEALAVNFGHEIEHTTEEATKLNMSGASLQEKGYKPKLVSEALISEYGFQKLLPVLQEISNVAEIEHKNTIIQ